VSTLTKAGQGVGQAAIHILREMANDIMKDVRLGRIIYMGLGTNGYGCRKRSLSQATKKYYFRNNSTYSYGAKTRKWLDKTMDVLEAW
jgi:hypothetical protein